MSTLPFFFTYPIHAQEAEKPSSAGQTLDRLPPPPSPSGHIRSARLLLDHTAPPLRSAVNPGRARTTALILRLTSGPMDDRHHAVFIEFHKKYLGCKWAHSSQSLTVKTSGNIGSELKNIFRDTSMMYFFSSETVFVVLLDCIENEYFFRTQGDHQFPKTDQCSSFSVEPKICFPIVESFPVVCLFGQFFC